MRVIYFLKKCLFKRCNYEKLLFRNFYKRFLSTEIEGKCEISFREMCEFANDSCRWSHERFIIASSTSYVARTACDENARRDECDGGLIPGVCNSNWIYHRGNYEATNGQTDEWTDGVAAGPGLRMNNGGPNEIFQFAAGHRNISLPSPSRLSDETHGFGFGAQPRATLLYLSHPEADDYRRRTNAEKKNVKFKGDVRESSAKIHTRMN